jgi:ABC-type phosphonate transport system ATPase subunit
LQVQTLLDAARVARLVNASGSTVAACLRNIPSRVTEVAGHGDHEGATRAIAVVLTMSGADYRQFQPVFPEWGAEREEFEDLVDDLSIVTDAIVDDVSLEGVVSNVFGEELD